MTARNKIAGGAIFMLSLRKFLCRKFNLVLFEEFHRMQIKLNQKMDEIFVDANLPELERIVAEMRGRK